MQGPRPGEGAGPTPPEVAAMRPLGNSVRKGAATLEVTTVPGASSSAGVPHSATASLFGGQGSLTVATAHAHLGQGPGADRRQTVRSSDTSSGSFRTATSASQASTLGGFNPTAASGSSASSMGLSRTLAPPPCAALAAVQQHTEPPPQRPRRSRVAPLALSTVPEIPFMASDEVNTTPTVRPGCDHSGLPVAHRTVSHHSHSHSG